jgi:hypothetical protein
MVLVHAKTVLTRKLRIHRGAELPVGRALRDEDGQGRTA